MPIPTVNHSRIAYYVRRYAESNMSATVTVVRKYKPVFNETTGELASASPSVIYTGKARVATSSGPLTYAVGDESSYFQALTVSIPVVTADVMVDDLVLVTAHPGDPAVVGRVFRVTDVEAGGQWMAARKLSVVGVADSQQWSWVQIPFQTSYAPLVAAGGSTTMTGTP